MLVKNEEHIGIMDIHIQVRQPYVLWMEYTDDYLEHPWQDKKCQVEPVVSTLFKHSVEFVKCHVLANLQTFGQQYLKKYIMINSMLFTIHILLKTFKLVHLSIFTLHLPQYIPGFSSWRLACLTWGLQPCMSLVNSFVPAPLHRVAYLQRLSVEKCSIQKCGHSKLYSQRSQKIYRKLLNMCSQWLTCNLFWSKWISRV